MNATLRMGCCVAAAAWAAVVHGHGLPIVVNVADDTLVASGGTENAIGFADQFFADSSLDAMLAPNGSNLVTRIPGFTIHDMETNSGLFLNVIPRPARGTTPTEERLLWYWSPGTGKVEPAPNGESLTVASGFGLLAVPEFGSEPLGPHQVAAPEGEDIGLHIHFLRYLLDNNPTAAIGAYGFFAQLSSSSYGTSDPLLVVLNNGLSAADLNEAALAINAAAFLPGDYNLDDVVDAADYTVWRDTLGSLTALAADGSGNDIVDAADYGVWLDHFGESIAGLTGEASALGAPTDSVSVPEPASIVLLAWWMTTLAAARPWRTAQVKTFRKRT